MNSRSSILHQLRSSEKWISSSSLSQELNISRAAISKHVKILRELGYEIETAPNRGYHFLSAPDLLLAEEILPLTKSKQIGTAQYRHHHISTSTNAEAKILAEEGCPEGTLVVAEEQTAGKGRKGREWTSPKQAGIYATLVLRPTLPLEDTPLLTLLTAIVTTEAIIATTDVIPTIKWPNDILLNGKKIAGILTEVSSEVDRVEYALIGIGLNVNTPSRKLPKRPIYPASSLKAETGTKHNRAELLAKWLEIFESEYNQLLAGNRTQLLDHWKKLANIIGKKATITRVNDRISGTIKDIDTDGALLLQTKNGNTQRILSGDVSFS